jgi:uncharacterized protein (TIGR03790 family)
MTGNRTVQVVLLLAGLGVLHGVPVHAQGPENVLIVINSAIPDSIQVGEYYQKKRRVPTDNVVRISLPAVEQVSRVAFEQRIQQPVQAWIERNRAQDRLLYIVLTKGVPLRVAGTAGRTGATASVDSELTLLYRRMTGQPVAPAGSTPNPYFHGMRPIAEARPFSHEQQDFYLVTRLDGYTVADVIALIDRGSDAGRDGRFVLDQKGSITPEPGNQWLERAAIQLRGLGMSERVVLDTSSAIVTNQANLLGYYSWGSNDPAMTNRQNGLTFAPGALAGSFVSTDGRTFKEPPPTWNHGRWENPRTFFAGSPQSMTGDLIRQGATGVSGHVAEPFLDATIRPDVLFPAYVSGFNLAESFYLAMPSLSWQTVIIGDPLAAPFRQKVLTAAEIDPGIDDASEMPSQFAARMLKVAVRPGRTPEAMALMMRAQSRVARDDRKGAEQALEQATLRSPDLADAHVLLATMYETDGDTAKATERYRRTLALVPGHIVALNNLAFMLAQQDEAARAEAVTMARKAVSLAPRSPAVLDTLAWVLHLSGDNPSARAPIAAALQLAPNAPDLLVHGAFIDAAANEPLAARIKLDRALTVDESLAERADVKELLAKLPARPQPPAAGRGGRETAPKVAPPAPKAETGRNGASGR